LSDHKDFVANDNSSGPRHNCRVGAHGIAERSIARARGTDNIDVSAAGITLTGSSPQQTLAGSSTSGPATITGTSHTVTLNSSALLSFQAAGGGGDRVLLADARLDVGRQPGQDLFGDLVGKVGQHVGGVVGLDVLDDGGGPPARHLDEGRRDELVVHLLERVSGEWRIQRGQHGGALVRTDLADDVGEVGRMELGDLGEGLDEVGPREAHRNEIDVGPGHKVAGPRRQAARQKAEAHAAHDGAARGVDAGHHEAIVADLEQDVLHADELATFDVEHLIVEHGVDQGDLFARQRGGREVARRHGKYEPSAVDVDLADLLPRHAQLLVVATDDAGRDRGRFGRQRREHVEQFAELRAGRVGCAPRLEKVIAPAKSGGSEAEGRHAQTRLTKTPIFHR